MAEALNWSLILTLVIMYLCNATFLLPISVLDILSKQLYLLYRIIWGIEGILIKQMREVESHYPEK